MTLLKKLFAKIECPNAQGKGEVIYKDGEHLLEIPFSLPGEIEMNNYDEDKLSSINFKLNSSHRAEPACPHFKQCGGCSLQHASEEFVTDWKKSLVVWNFKTKKIFPKFCNTYVTPERSRRRAVF